MHAIGQISHALTHWRTFFFFFFWAQDSLILSLFLFLFLFLFLPFFIYFLFGLNQSYLYKIAWKLNSAAYPRWGWAQYSLSQGYFFLSFFLLLLLLLFILFSISSFFFFFHFWFINWACLGCYRSLLSDFFMYVFFRWNILSDLYTWNQRWYNHVEYMIGWGICVLINEIRVSEFYDMLVKWAVLLRIITFVSLSVRPWTYGYD